MSLRIGVDRRVLSVLVGLVLAACLSGLSVSVARAEGTPCLNEQARAEQPFALELSDCRAYEMVSPLEKGDSDATKNHTPQFGTSVAEASLSGEAIAYESQGSFAESEGHAILNEYLARRDSNGWVDRGITPLTTAFATSIISPYYTLTFTPELTEGVALSETPLNSETKEGYEDLYLTNFAQHSYRLVNTEPLSEEPFQPPILPTHVVGASQDLSHILYAEEGAPLTEWANGSVHRITEGSGEFWRQVSTDGSRVILSSGNQFYVREDGTKLIDVSSSQRTDCNVQRKEAEPAYKCTGAPEPDPAGPQSQAYGGASVNASRVFFLSCAKLTDNSTAVVNTQSKIQCASNPDNVTREESSSEGIETEESKLVQPEGNDLYEYDLESGVLSDLTPDHNPADRYGASVMNVLDVSEDGSVVYFVAEGDLAGAAVSGQPNLYVSRDGGTPTFIATLAPARDFAFDRERNGDSNDWNPLVDTELGPAVSAVRETPDGEHFAFLSIEKLTGYDNQPVEPQDCKESNFRTTAPEFVPCAELYVYNAQTGKLACASCDPDGSRPVGPAQLSEDIENAQREKYLPRNFSDDGNRLFFDSKDALVPHDSNGSQDVYEWNPEGAYGCTSSEGCVHPISNVAGNYGSFFMDASPSGDDVFFATGSQLLPTDTDNHVDVYDARVGGGFPVTVAPPECDNADSCKGEVSPQPGVFGPPPSATFSGAGNVAPTSPPTVAVKPKSKAKQCKKGYLRRKGRCVKKLKRQAAKSNRLDKKGRK
jgi:hypothetical protein